MENHVYVDGYLFFTARDPTLNEKEIRKIIKKEIVKVETIRKTNLTVWRLTSGKRTIWKKLLPRKVRLIFFEKHSNN